MPYVPVVITEILCARNVLALYLHTVSPLAVDDSNHHMVSQ